MRGVNLSPAHPHAGGVLQRSGEPLVTDRRCALDETKYVKARAARLLGVSERSLWYKLRKQASPESRLLLASGSLQDLAWIRR